MTVSLNDSSTHERYTLSLHDALPISKTTDKVKILPNPDFCVEIVPGKKVISKVAINIGKILLQLESDPEVDRKSTRLNSSHVAISYAVFCLKEKRRTPTNTGLSYITY